MLRLTFLTLFVVATMWRFGWQTTANNFDRYLLDKQKTRVIYGQDNRKEFFEIEDALWFERAQSTVALFDYQDLVLDKEEPFYHLQTDPYGPSHHLCQDEAFYDQPVGAFCSGFLIDTDVVVTAGHCIRNHYNCENVRLVFGYQYNEPGGDPLEIRKENVYGCSAIIHTQNVGPTGADYAILQLDRHVEEFAPLEYRTRGKVENEARFTVIGYPKGLPGKIAHGGSLRNNDNRIYFVSDLDTFNGNSGSAVFNSETGLVEGLLVRGEKDFDFDLNNGCYRSYVCKQKDCRGEDVVRIQEVIKHLSPEELYTRND